jgi:hypothetical protein
MNRFCADVSVQVAASVLSERNAGATDLPLARDTAELHHELVNLRKPSCANGMAAREKATRRVDGYAAVKAGCA